MIIKNYKNTGKNVEIDISVYGESDDVQISSIQAGFVGSEVNFTEKECDELTEYLYDNCQSELYELWCEYAQGEADYLYDSMREGG